MPPQAVVPPRPTRPAVPVQPQHLYKAASLLFLFALLYRYFAELTHVFLIVYAAAILAVGLNAIVQRVPVQRKWVAALLGVSIVAATLGAVAVGAPLLASQLRGFTSQGPRLQAELHAWSEWLRARTGLDIELLSDDTLRQLQEALSGVDVLGRAQGLLETLFVPLLILLGGLFAVAKPNDRLLSPLLRAVPRDRRLAIRRVFELLAVRLRGWIRGTLLDMLFVGALSILAFYLLGVPYALLLGVLNGFTEFIPLVGPWIGGAAAVLAAFLVDPGKALWTALAVLAIQQIENHLLTPLVMSRAADVHPFVTLFALLLFGTLFGFLGLLLALPLVLLFWTLVEVLWVERAIDTDEDPIAPVVEE